MGLTGMDLGKLALLKAITEYYLEDLMLALDTLSEREKKCLQLRFGLLDGQPKTLEVVGNEFGVSRERIRQVIVKAIRKLKHPSRLHKIVHTEYAFKKIHDLEKELILLRQDLKLKEISGTINIEELDLPVRIINALRWGNIDTTSQLYSIPPKELLRFRGLGTKSVRLIMDKLGINV